MSSLLGNYFGNSEFSTKVTGRLLDDLMLTEFLEKFFGDIDVKSLLTYNTEDIKYRNAVISDLLEHRIIFRHLEKLCSCIGDLFEIRTFIDPNENPLQTFGSFFILKEYFDILNSTRECIEENKESLKSEGLKNLLYKISEIIKGKFSCNFADIWSKYASGFEKIGSFTYGFFFVMI